MENPHLKPEGARLFFNLAPSGSRRVPSETF